MRLAGREYPESQTEDTLEADPVAAEDGATIAGEEAAEVELETTAELGITLEGEALAEAGFLATGPGIVIGLAILLVTIIVTIVVSEAVAEAALSSLDTLNNDIKNNSLDILAYAQDDTQKTKLQDIWAEITYPDIYSTTTLPSPGPTDPILFQVADGGTTSESTASLIVPDWNYANWSPTLYGGWIIRSGSRTIPDLVPVPVGQSRLVSYNSISPYMRYWGWDGLEYEASRFGTNWVVTKGQPQDNDVVCPALASTGGHQFTQSQQLPHMGSPLYSGRGRQCQTRDFVRRIPSGLHHSFHKRGPVHADRNVRSASHGHRHSGSHVFFHRRFASAWISTGEQFRARARRHSQCVASIQRCAGGERELLGNGECHQRRRHLFGDLESECPGPDPEYAHRVSQSRAGGRRAACLLDRGAADYASDLARLRRG